MDNATERLLRKIQENKKSLNIARLPDKTKEEFTKFAKEDFCNDYGMAFAWAYNQAIEYQKVKAVLLDNNLLIEMFKWLAEGEKKDVV